MLLEKILIGLPVVFTYIPGGFPNVSIGILPDTASRTLIFCGETPTLPRIIIKIFL